MRKIVAIILFLVPAKLPAQLECSVKNFNTSNGMLQNTISGMAMDNMGFLWLSTQNGIVRYDGTNFKTFSPKPGNSDKGTSSYFAITYLPIEKMILVRTRDGVVYTIKDGLPVVYSKGEKFYYYDMIGNFPNLSAFNKFNIPVNTLYSDSNYYWNQDVREMLSLNATDFVIYSYGSLFYCKSGIRQNKIHLNFVFKTFIKSGKYNLAADEKGNLHLFDSTINNFRDIQVNWATAKNTAGNKEIPVYYRDTYNGESYCYYNSIFYQLKVEDKIVRLIPRFSISKKGHFWTGILYDKLNSIYYLTTLTEGLFQIRIKNIKTFDLAEKIKADQDPASVINYAVLKTSDSSILTTTGFEFTSSANGITINKKGNIHGDRETIAQLGDTAIVCVEYGQLYYYHRSDGYKKRHLLNEEYTHGYNSYVTLLKPEGDSLWIFNNFGITNYRNGRLRVFFARSISEKVPVFSSRLFYRLSKDEFFISNDEGLFRIKTSPSLTLDTVMEMRKMQVRHISPYKDMLILSVYRSGLYIYKDNKFYKVPLDDELPQLVYCHNTYIEPNGDIWITTDKGLFRSSVSSLIEAALKPGITPFYFYYGVNDGIENTEFNGGRNPPYAVLPNGQLFYPSMGGIVSFDPKDLNEEILNAPIPIERVEIDKLIIEPVTADTFRLPANYKYLAIDLSVPNFSEPENLLLEYKLDNLEWKRISLKNNVQRLLLLEDISSGYHKLIIRKRTGFGSTDLVYRTITLYKKKHIYEKIWFYLVLLLLAGLLIFFITRLNARTINRKRRRLQELVDEQTYELSRTVEVKELLINVISHDMTTPLRHITFISDILSKGLEKDPEKMKSALLDIRSTSERILTGSVNIINWIKYNKQRVEADLQTTNLYDLVNETVEMYIPIASNKNITIRNEVPRSKLVEVDQTILGIIINNVISNAVKYSQKGEVRIYLEGSDSDDKTILKIADNGTGINKTALDIINEILKGKIEAIKTTTKLNTGLGYIMISELMKIHGLSINVESELNEGTTVSIAISG